MLTTENLIKFLTFQYQVSHDDRVPAASFVLLDQKYGIKLPDPLFWAYMFLLMFLLTLVIMVFAVIIYKWIIQRRGTPTSYLLGYGIIIPLVLPAPALVCDWFGVENIIHRFTMCAPAAAVVFRCIEAMHNTSSIPAVEQSLLTYVQYCASFVEFRWDKSTNQRIPVSAQELWTNLWRLGSQLIMASLLLSYLLQYDDLAPFPTNVTQPDRFHLNPITDLFQPGQLCNNYLRSLLLFLSIRITFTAAESLNHIQGYSAVPSFHNPLFLSKSPSDFWGARWNMPVHGLLKKGVYKPLIRQYSHPFVATVTFLASGLLHDYTWWVSFRNTHFSPIVFKQSAFFVWCGITMVLERPLGPYLDWIDKLLPRPVVSTLIAMTAIPVAHWLVGDLVVGGFFHHYALGVFQIVPMNDDVA